MRARPYVAQTTSRCWPTRPASTSPPACQEPGRLTSPERTSGPSSTSTYAARRKRCWTGPRHATPRSRSAPRGLTLAHSTPAKAGIRRGSTRLTRSQPTAGQLLAEGAPAPVPRTTGRVEAAGHVAVTAGPGLRAPGAAVAGRRPQGRQSSALRRVRPRKPARGRAEWPNRGQAVMPRAWRDPGGSRAPWRQVPERRAGPRARQASVPISSPCNRPVERSHGQHEQAKDDRDDAEYPENPDTRQEADNQQGNS
jgi:hypothetical protein